MYKFKIIVLNRNVTAVITFPSADEGTSLDY